MNNDYTSALERRLEWLKWCRRPDVRKRHVEDRMALGVYESVLETGDTYFMNQRFCQLVDHARQTIPDDLKFEETWMLTPSGFMWLDEPFLIPKPVLSEGEISAFDHIKEMRISAIGWNRVPESEIERLNRTQKKEIARIGGGPLVLGAYQFVCFLDWQHFNPQAENGFGLWSYFVLSPGASVIERIHRFEAASAECSFSAEYKPGRVSDMLHEIRWVYTAMHLMSQKLAATRNSAPGRQRRRNMKRQSTPFVPLVKIVTLRRLEEANQGAANSGNRTVDWQWQWDVDGHWRNQWYPNEQVHRIIWVEDYVKGPPEKPFKPLQVKIFKASR